MENNPMPNLNTNMRDDIATLIRGTLQTVVPPSLSPSLISEIINRLIPNQRVDRIADYCRILNERLTLIEDKFDLLTDIPNNVELLEEGFIQASRAISAKRHKYIASIVINGLSENEAKTIQAKHLLSLLQELNEFELIWLQYYSLSENAHREKFEAKHENVLKKIYTNSSTPKDTYIEAALQKSYNDHLQRLNLIIFNIERNRETRNPIISRSGEFSVNSKSITALGFHLVEMANMNEDIGTYE